MSGSELATITKIHTVAKYINKDTVPKQLHYNNYISTHELIFFLEGENKTVIDSSILHDRPDFLRYIPKGQTSSEYTVFTLSPSICIDVYFDASEPISEHVFGLSDMNILSNRFSRLYTVWEKKQYGYYSEAMMILYDILHTIQRKRYNYYSSAQKNNAEKAYNYISDNYRERNFDFSVLPDICGLKHSQFNKIFKEIYGITCVEIVRQKRIEYAKELIITSRYSMAEIAERCGFDNQYYFSSVFKKVTGFPPSKYTFK